jgi:hypothetical protein
LQGPPVYGVLTPESEDFLNLLKAKDPYMPSLETAELAYGDAWYEVRTKRSLLHTLKQPFPMLGVGVFAAALSLLIFLAVSGGNLYMGGTVTVAALATAIFLIWREPLRGERNIHEAERAYVEAQKEWLADYGFQGSLSNVTALRFPWFPEERNAHPFGTAELFDTHTGTLVKVTLSRDSSGAYALYDEAREIISDKSAQEEE